MLYQFALGVVFAGSVLIRKPLTGFIIAQLYRAEPGLGGPPRRAAGDERVHARVGGAVPAARRRLRDPHLLRAGRLARASRRSLWACRRSACCCSWAIATCRSGSSSSAHRHRSPTPLLERPVDVGPVALQRAQPRALARVDQRRRPHAHVHRRAPRSARSAIHTCPNAVGCTWSVITRLRAPKSAQVERRVSPRREDDRVRLVDPARARAPEVLRDRHQQHPVAALAQEARRPARGSAANASASQSQRAHVVDADVQAADVVAGVRERGPLRERRDLLRRRRRRSARRRPRSPCTAARARAPSTAPTTAARRPTGARRRRW